MPRKVEFFKSGFDCRDLEKIFQDFFKNFDIFKAELTKDFSTRARFDENSYFRARAGGRSSSGGYSAMLEEVQDLCSRLGTHSHATTSKAFIEDCVQPVCEFCERYTTLKQPYDFKALQAQCEGLIAYVSDTAAMLDGDKDKREAKAVQPYAQLCALWNVFWTAHFSNFQMAYVYDAAKKGIEVDFENPPDWHYVQYTYPSSGSPKSKLKYGILGDANKAVARMAGSAYGEALKDVHPSNTPDEFRTVFVKSWEPKEGAAYMMARSLQATSSDYVNRLQKTLHQQTDKLCTDTKKLTVKAYDLIQRNRDKKSKKPGLLSKFKSFFKRKTK